jgi:hypothetical protein
MLNFNLAPALAFDRKPSGLEIITVTLAFDREPDGDNKRTDSFERLHAKRAPITKAGVSPYYGREIPKGEELGLEPNKVYKLLRDPEEIRKGAATSHNIPLLSKHVPHSADDHDGNITVGTVGSDSEYEHPYPLQQPRGVERDGIDHVEQGTQKELSSAYSYDADMTPGTYEGEPYDGVMRNMVEPCLPGEEGPRRLRTSPSTKHCNPNLEEILSMTKLKSMKATVAYGALLRFPEAEAGDGRADQSRRRARDLRAEEVQGINPDLYRSAEEVAGRQAGAGRRSRRHCRRRAEADGLDRRRQAPSPTARSPTWIPVTSTASRRAARTTRTTPAWIPAWRR